MKDFSEQKKLIDDFGWVAMQDKSLGMDIECLSVELADWINKCRFKTFSHVDVPDGNLLQVIAYLSERERKNELTSAIYELLPSIPELYRFATSEQMISFVEGLGVESPSLGTLPVIRIDRPGEEFRSTPWHQDYWFSFSSLKSIVVWIPLGHISKVMGWLSVIPGSHKEGFRPFRERREETRAF